MVGSSEPRALPLRSRYVPRRAPGPEVRCGHTGQEAGCFEAPLVELQHLKAGRADHAPIPGRPPAKGSPLPAGADAAPILRLQRLAGNRAVRDLLRAGHGVRIPVQLLAIARPRRILQRKPSAADKRRRSQATALKAADARALLQAALPFVLERMTNDQIGQVQKVFDAAVINPGVQEKATEILRKGTRDYGSIRTVDPAAERKSSKVMQDYVPIAESDKRVRLDATTLLAKDALTPRTDNPDEAKFLPRVRATLAQKGIWLRFEPKLVRDPEDPSRHIFDPRQFEAWLTVGPNGTPLKSATGEITREVLLDSAFGASYWENVDHGPAQRALDTQIHTLLDAIDSSYELREELRKIRAGAAFGVVETVDFVGGADFPDTKRFDAAHKLVVRAMELNSNGNLTGSQAFLVNASVITRQGAQQLKQYLDDTQSGGDRVVPVLKVLRTAGHVAEAGLAVTGVVGLARGGIALAAGDTGAAAVSSDIDVAADQLAERYAAQNGIHADELSQVRYVKQPPGSVAGGVKPGTSSGAGTGWHKW